MENITVTQVSTLSLSDLRNNVAEAVVRAYGAERDYAIKVCEVFSFPWYLVEHNDKGDEAKLVHAEKKELFAVLNKAKHSNPSTVWARVRKYAQEHMEPKTAEGEAPTAETSSVGARQNRSLTLRLVEELTTLYKACKNADSLSDKERQAHTHITSALIAMGVDVATID
jgi:hypothetical protein